MANRYLRATGNWNGPVWAATASGVAGSAATPTISDNVYIYASYSVTLTADAYCSTVNHTAGTLSLDSYTLDVRSSFHSDSTTARTINLGTGHLMVNMDADYGSGYIFWFDGSNLTLNAGTSLVSIGLKQGSTTSIRTLSKAFYDVILKVGYYSTSSVDAIVTGSPTFRSLTIQGMNNVAHTIKLDNGATLTTERLLAVGAGASHPLNIAPSSGTASIQVDFGSYGQYVEMNVSGTGAGSRYIGSNSTDSTSTWILQEPPKLGTLSDAFPGTALGADWSAWDVDQVTVADGKATINTTTTASTYRGFETAEQSWDGTETATSVQVFYGAADPNIFAYLEWHVSAGNSVYVKVGNGRAEMQVATRGLWVPIGDVAHTDGNYYRLRETGGTVYMDMSTDGTSWTNGVASATPAFSLKTMMVLMFTETTAVVTARDISFANYNTAVEEPANTVKYFNGTSWSTQVTKRYDGAEWV